MVQSIGDIMTGAVIIASPDEATAVVAARLTKNGISALPVCDAEGHVLGVISEGDLMRPFSQANSLRRDWWLAVLAEGTELAPAFLDYVRQDKHLVRDLMTQPAHTALEKLTVPEAADELIRLGIKRLPVLRDGRLVGIVSRADLVRVLYDHPSLPAHSNK